MKKGKSFLYIKVKEFAEDNDYSMEELGRDLVGEGFIVLRHSEKDIVISFVLSGTSGGYVYDCIYSDL